MNSKILLKDYIYFSTMKSSPIVLHALHHLRWQPLTEGFIKINTDEVYNQSTHDVGVGVVAHDNKGMLLGGIAQHSTNSIDALHTECFTVLAGIQLSHDKGRRSIHIKADLNILVNKFNRVRPDLSVLGAQDFQYLGTDLHDIEVLRNRFKRI
ncbi:hypothetical protein V6N12_076375 [Hibiscus sabdariffa]|uniref:RNase H type-1 domain-containing protein n=1 Tax=Hibiscus sabdariffa TaxID=183260 RepID=A0ABR2D9L8_9ROSI